MGPALCYLPILLTDRLSRSREKNDRYLNFVLFYPNSPQVQIWYQMPTTDASERENEYYLLSRKSRRGCIIISKHNEELTFSYETLKNREVRHYRIVVCDVVLSQMRFITPLYGSSIFECRRFPLLCDKTVTIHYEIV